MLRSKIQNLFVGVIFFTVIAFSQTTETGSAFNRFISPQAGVNPLSGTVAFNKSLVSIGAGAINTTFDLSYSGNIFKDVETRNDKSPGSWIGLGWAMGRATIICEHRGTMAIDDDRYYILTPTGEKHEMFYSGTRWWVESQPYWIVSRLETTGTWSWTDAKNITQNKTYTIVTGWKIIDESGFINWYGDYDETDIKDPIIRNATQYDLSWPEGPGVVGYAIAGNTYLYPSAWNLRRQFDLEGNWLEYDYEQTSEKIAINNWTSSMGYTKETYLTEVRSSNNSKIDFILANKGEGEFSGEYWDSQGEQEKIGLLLGVDAFVDPLQRRYLQAIEVYGMDTKKIGRIDLCYKPLKVLPGGIELGGYTKRLLVSVIHSNEDGVETDREDYEYFTDAARASSVTSSGSLKEPLGALKKIRGPNCGTVEFTYSNRGLGVSGKEKIEAHSQTIEGLGDSLYSGQLEDGTQYVVDEHGVAFALIGGVWKEMARNYEDAEALGTTDFGDCGQYSILMGNRGWYAIIVTGKTVMPEATNEESSRCRPLVGETRVFPVVWDGKKWSAVGEKDALVDNGSRDYIWAGPDYLVKTRAYSKSTFTRKMDVMVLWSRWGGTYSYTINDVDNSPDDRAAINVSASKQHILVSYIKDDVMTGNSRALVVLTFSGSSLVKTFSTDDLDNNSKYFLAGNYFYGLEETPSSLTGYNASAWHWNGDGWTKLLKEVELHGNQGVMTNMGSSDDYFVVRHNDDDDMTIFDWDGEEWDVPYKNRNMVSHDDFDLFVESRWQSKGGNDFFVAMQPRNIWETKSVCISFRLRRWKLRCTKRVHIPYWQTTYNAAKIARYEKRDGEWSGTEASTLDWPRTEKNILAGTDWYAERACVNKAWIWNSHKWHTEDIPHESLSDAKSFGNGIFYKITKENSKSTVTLYRKIDDSFVNAFGAYLVSQKTVSDPITDQIHKFNFSYTFVNSKDGFAFDGPNNTPLVDVFKVTQPDGSIIQQTLCNPNQNSKEDIRLALGDVCKEEKFDANGNLISWTTNTFKRHSEAGWPTQIHIDRLTTTEGVIGGLKAKSNTVYNYALNGMPSQVTVLSGGKQSESNTIYAAEKYPTILLPNNRVTEVAGSYSCSPDCSTNGKITSGTGIRYGNADGNTVPSVIESWNLEPETLQKGTNFIFDWNSTTQNAFWKKNNTNTKFAWGRVTESVDRLGKYTANFYENSPAGVNFATVYGSGVNESLIMSGQTCNVANVTQCNIIELTSGNATDGVGLDYGRFASTALLVESGVPFVAVIPGSQGGKYRFSTWVQGVDFADQNLQMLLNGTVVKEWPLAGSDAGTWQKVEWEGTLISGNVSLSLQVASGKVRLQDMRLLPYHASASVVFWDKHWSVPITQVSDRDIGSYSKLDAAGRIVGQYTENAKGNVILSEKLTYVTNSCKSTPQGINKLASLTVNDVSVPLPPVGGTQTYVLPSSEPDFTAIWKVSQSGDHVRYKLFAEGNEASAQWVSACCGEVESAYGDATTLTSWVLKIDVEPYDVLNKPADYTIYIQRDATGWTDHGGPLGTGIGSYGKYFGNEDVNHIAFVSHSGGKQLQEAVYNGNSWVTVPIVDGYLKNFQGVISGNTRYLIHLTDISSDYSFDKAGTMITRTSTATYASSFGNQGNSWSNYGLLSSDKNIDMVRIALDAQGTPWTIYRGEATEDGGKVARWNPTQAQWENAGSLPVFSEEEEGPSSFVAGGFSERRPLDADIVLGGDGHMYVAYIGSIASLGNDSAAARFVVVKRWYNASESRVSEGTIGQEIWAGPSLFEEEETLVPAAMPNYDGDIVELNDEFLLGARRLKLSSDGNNLYLAVTYAVEIGETMMEALTVFKGSMQSQVVTEENAVYRSKLVFEPLVDASVSGSALGIPVEVEQKRVVYLNATDPFDFVVRNGIPYLSFANAANKENISVIRYSGSRWLSVGNPAFASVGNSNDQLDLAVNSQGSPYVVYRSDNFASKRYHRVVPLKYVATGDRDLSLTSVDFGGVTTSLVSEFRQYILNYSASFDASTTQMNISPTPKTISDIVGMQIENNGVVVGSWVIDPTTTESEKYMNGVSVTHSGSSVPAFVVPLAEGLNRVVIKILGKNGKQLCYTFDFAREFLPDPEITVDGAGLSGPVIDLYTPLADSNTVDSSSTRDSAIVLYTYLLDSTSVQQTYCINFLTGWILRAFGINYDHNICFTWDWARDSLVTDTLTDGNGTSYEIKIASIRPTVNSDSGIVNTTTQTILPSMFSELIGYTLFAGETISLADRATVKNGSIAAGSKIEIGAEGSVVSGNLISGGNVFLRNRASVQKITLAGNLDVQDGATYTSVEQTTISLPVVPTVNVVSGTNDVLVTNNQTVSLVAGSYRDFHAYSQSVINFAPGDYYFSSFTVEPDVNLIFGSSDTGVRIWVQGNMNFADRITLENWGTPEKLMLYTNSTGSVRLGTGNSIRAVIVAPSASVDVPTGTTVSGNIWSKNLTIQPDVIFE